MAVNPPSAVAGRCVSVGKGGGTESREGVHTWPPDVRWSKLRNCE